VGLAGSKLVIPPATSATIVLHVQKPNYWIMPYAAQYGSPNGVSAGQATVSNMPGGIPALQYTNGQRGPVTGIQGGQQQIPPIQISPIQASQSSQISSQPFQLLIVAIAAAVILASVSVIIVAIRLVKH
jgi:hypothetical protein